MKYAKQFVMFAIFHALSFSPDMREQKKREMNRKLTKRPNKDVQFGKKVKIQPQCLLRKFRKYENCNPFQKKESNIAGKPNYGGDL
jgi:hypothetical protein